MAKEHKDLQIVGRAEYVDFPEMGLKGIPARVDTGAKTSAIWASGVIEKDGGLEFVLFAPKCQYFTGEKIRVTDYSQKVIASSIGVAETRYVVKFLVEVKGKKIRASFTLANRSEQVYPMLIGRNILRGKFLVDVKQGKTLIEQEVERSAKLQGRKEPA